MQGVSMIASAPNPKQTTVLQGMHGRVVACDSAYDVEANNEGRDVLINGSYLGVLPARFLANHRPRGVVGVDAGIGPEGAGIAGLWFLEALGIPAAAVDVLGILLGDGRDVSQNGVVSFVNEPAKACGVQPGMTAFEAGRMMLENDAVPRRPRQVTNRTVVHQGSDGRQVVCTDSIAFGVAEDTGRNVLVTAGHTGRSAVPYLLKVRPYGFICSDGGVGRALSGMAGLQMVERDGLPGATVSAATAKMGDALSTFNQGIISAVNVGASACGVTVGMPAKTAALLLLNQVL